MEYKVIKHFRDKDTNELFVSGGEYKTDNKKRGKELQIKGYLGEVIENPSILKQNVAEVKVAITEELSQDELNELLKEETEGENRKGVKEHIESLLKGDKVESSEV